MFFFLIPWLVRVLLSAHKDIIRWVVKMLYLISVCCTCTDYRIEGCSVCISHISSDDCDGQHGCEGECKTWHSSHRQTTSSHFLYKLLSSSRVVQTKNRQLWVNNALLCPHTFKHFISSLLACKHDSLLRLLLTNNRTDHCHMTCGAAQWK